MPSVQWSRANQTNPSPYDQIFILSENVINEAFRAMFPSPVSFSRQDQEAVRTRRTGQWISNAKVEAPSISMHVEERNPSFMAFFTLSFDSGRIHLRTSPPGAPSTFGNYPLTGWKLVFKTRIASKVLNSNDPKYAVYQSSAGFRDSVFELAQLYLDTSDVGAGGGFVPSKSYFGGTTLPNDTLQNLKLFVNEWLTSADDRQLNVIGYSLTRQQPTSPRNWVGTFAPAVIDYAPYAWIDPRRPTVETDGLRENALAMLTYTDSSRRHGYGGLSHSGVYTEAGAAFCMNRDLFWNQFLLPVLQELNQKTEVIPQTPRRLVVETRYVLGKNPKHRNPNDSYFNWRRQESNGQLHWTWKGQNQKNAVTWQGSSASYRVAHVGELPYPESAARGLATDKPPFFSVLAHSSTDLSFAAGGQDIKVKGTIVYDYHLKFSANPSYMAFHSETEWNLGLRLQAVRGGGLQIVKTGNPTVRAKTVKASNSKWNPGSVADLNRGLRGLENNIVKYLRAALANISNQLARDINNLHKLFLPGAGVFRFGTPMFNNRGDIIADLEYLNTSAPTGRFIVNRAVRDPSDETVHEEDLGAQFEHIALFSEEYPEDEPVFDDEAIHSRIQLDYNTEDEEPEALLQLEHPVEHYSRDAKFDDDQNHEDYFPGPGPGPLAGVDWDAVQRTERPWKESDDDAYPEDEYPVEPKKPEKPETPKEEPKKPKEEKKPPKVEVPTEDDEDGPPPLGSGPLDG
ncbi:uncharacterized protein BDV14DRAFT_204709 [Aspergillus stella-maris]|uniref:uncharacterized protein n=1 Tax=Aspergillus stella-maris TaxID=1810926 RepID=UPI003CCD27A0